MYKKQFELVEKLLSSYPEEWRRNYFENKKTLVIEDNTGEEYTIGGIGALYDENDNIIEIYNPESITHELLHISFRDGEKLNKKIFEDEEIYFSNGVAYKKVKENKESYCGKALTEGFVEYLNRKINYSKSHAFEYFIVDLLVSIYGEDILKYPLTNDVKGFYTDDRFHDIVKLRLSLDQYYSCFEFIKLFNYVVSPMMDRLHEEEQRDIMITADKNITYFYNSVINSIETIIDEYKHCNKPLITLEQLENKLRNFLVDSDYKVYIQFSKTKEYDVEKDIQKIIKNLN